MMNWRSVAKIILPRSRGIGIHHPIGNPDDRIIKSPYEEVVLSQQSYFDYVWEWLEYHCDRTALVDSVSGSNFTYGDVHASAKKFSLALRKLNLDSRSNVLAIMMKNSVEYPIAFNGAARANVTTTTLNPMYMPGEVAKQLQLAGSDTIITSTEFLPVVHDASKQMLKPLSVILTDGQEDGCYNFYDMMSGLQVDEEPNWQCINPHDDVVIMPFSSGTTGPPKGVMLTHSNLIANINQTIPLRYETNTGIPKETTLRGNEQETSLCVLPLFHMFALNCVMGTDMRMGDKIVLIPKFEPRPFIDLLRKHKPTQLHLAPPLASFLVNHPDVETKDLDEVDNVYVGAAPLGPKLTKQFKEKFPNTFVREGWGMTELSACGLLAPKYAARDGSCGVVVPNAQSKIIDLSTGRTLGPGEPGELCFAGPSVMKGYLNNPEATCQSIKNGWLHTGDVAYYDQDGHFYIVDRIKELIKVKGFQVAPAELEDMLRGMDDVKDVAVIGIPSEKHGEVPRAYIVKRPESNLDEDKVMKHVKNNLASHKQLAGGAEFVDEIPKSAAGKILRRVILEKFKSDRVKRTE